eukprot:968312-Amphidinium_carterae.1
MSSDGYRRLVEDSVGFGGPVIRSPWETNPWLRMVLMRNKPLMPFEARFGLAVPPVKVTIDAALLGPVKGLELDAGWQPCNGLMYWRPIPCCALPSYGYVCWGPAMSRGRA